MIKVTFLYGRIPGQFCHRRCNNDNRRGGELILILSE